MATGQEAWAPRGWAAPLKPINVLRTLLTPIILAYLEPLNKDIAHFTQVFHLTAALWQLTGLSWFTDL